MGWRDPRLKILARTAVRSLEFQRALMAVHLASAQFDGPADGSEADTVGQLQHLKSLQREPNAIRGWRAGPRGFADPLV
jgi:hypothetical protein